MSPTPEFLFRGFRRHELYAVKFSGGRALLAFVNDSFAIVFAQLKGCLVEVS